jgi:hypothetical protein
MVTMHMDSLAVMDDEELSNTFKGLSRALSRNRDKQRAYELQVNMCYVQREIQIRKTRKETHEQRVVKRRR